MSTGYCPWWDWTCGDEFKVYQFSSNYSGKCLDLSIETSNPAAMVQTTCAAGDRSQYWMVWSGAYNGSLTIENFFSFQCLAIASAQVHSQVQQQSCTWDTGNPIQTFFYV